MHIMVAKKKVGRDGARPIKLLMLLFYATAATFVREQIIRMTVSAT